MQAGVLVGVPALENEEEDGWGISSARTGTSEGASLG
jgi:hypothetical protein